MASCSPTDGATIHSSPQSIVPQSDSILSEMKDLSSTSSSSRHARNSLIYPKKRPSPHGVSKSHKSPLFSQDVMRKSPRSVKAALIQQRQQLRRDGVILEDEYREDIRCYMHEMEVRFRLFL